MMAMHNEAPTVAAQQCGRDVQTESRAIVRKWHSESADINTLAAYIATALAAKDAEMKGWKKTATEYASELHSLRSQLAETRKAMNYLNDAVAVGLSDQEVSRRAKLLFAARRALEAQGGE